ncbi:cytochrome c [Ulvibacter sp. MAR_2010_11]|uniref:c-type cytochrome n=1 Tax=Ulvibacter sp. MAR_2010_11 TaxID=1250229 RepID=UPI000C2C1CC4|nr:cytochrome c [Ulvibacter sp. MAR_2010_11]PKA83814.1 cytochrome c [Ulvibacter sp. MAR_2010_11]
MKKLFYLALISLLFMACNDSTKIKNKVKLGPISVTETPLSELEKSIERGAVVYEDFCMQCHMTNGKGVPGNFPPLAGSNWLTEKRKESIHSVKYGQRGEIQVNGVTYDGIMTPMGLSDAEVADVLNYVMNSWDNKQAKMVTVEEVTAVEK